MFLRESGWEVVSIFKNYSEYGLESIMKIQWQMSSFKNSMQYVMIIGCYDITSMLIYVNDNLH